MSDSEARTPPGAPRDARRPDRPRPSAEKGTRDGERISLDRRLFVKFTACGNCRDVNAAAANALDRAGVTGALYLDANDPRGIGLVAVSEDPEWFVTTWRDLLASPPLRCDGAKGRSSTCWDAPIPSATSRTSSTCSSSGRSPASPTRRSAGRSGTRFAVPSPSRSSPPPTSAASSPSTAPSATGTAPPGSPSTCASPATASTANDNDFIIGLLGANLFPLSSIVQAMRGTEQTSRYLESLGPFFVGRVAWQGRGWPPAEGP